MTLLAGRRVLVTGVLTDASIAFAVARLAQEQGAEVVLSAPGRARRLTERAARRLPAAAPVLDVDVTDPVALAGLAEVLGSPLHGLVHSIAYAPPSCLGDGLPDAPWTDVAETLHVSAYSLAALTRSVRPLLAATRGAVVAFDFDNRHQAWPRYGWMGVAKAALESTARYLAREVGPDGIRVNLVCAGPLRTLAARGIPGFAGVVDAWAGRAPLGWDTRDPEPAARAAVALLSDWFPATTGEMVHVDGGAHAVAG